jgi:hypothetical protein
MIKREKDIIDEIFEDEDILNMLGKKSIEDYVRKEFLTK